jgi:hypothetical protein
MTVAEERLFEGRKSLKKRRIVLEFARQYQEDSEAYQHFDVAHWAFYCWKKGYASRGTPV